MLYTEDKRIRLGGVTLPGIIKKLEVTQAARIDEQEVEGSAVKPKQAVGYEDAKIAIELILDSTPSEEVTSKLERLQRLFRQSKAPKPVPLDIVCTEVSIAGVTKVLFKDLKHSRTNKTDQYAVTIELWEYIPSVVTVNKSSKAGATVPLDINYQDYLVSRGTAPTSGTTTSSPFTKPFAKQWASPAVDKPPSAAWVDKMFSDLRR